MMFGENSEIVEVNRELVAILVPDGTKVSIPGGTAATITQALGNSYTIFIEGRLFRVNGEDADAIGKPVPEPLSLPEDASDEIVTEMVWKQLSTCYDPEIPINIVELGLIYDCVLRSEADRRTVDVQMTLTAPGCGMGDFLVQDVKQAIQQIPKIDEVDVELVFEPPWNQSMMSEAARLQTGMY